MQTYLIDGNNLIGKIKELWQLQSKDKQGAREKLIYRIDRFFAGKKVGVNVIFDGFPGVAINSSKSKIFYSESKIADEVIKKRIENSKNSKNLIVVSSDRSITDFAKKCSCKIVTSEDFGKDLIRKKENEEENIKKSISNDEIKKLFGL